MEVSLVADPALSSSAFDGVRGGAACRGGKRLVRQIDPGVSSCPGQGRVASAIAISSDISERKTIEDVIRTCPDFARVIAGKIELRIIYRHKININISRKLIPFHENPISILTNLTLVILIQ
jgi:hypothetical protein